MERKSKVISFRADNKKILEWIDKQTNTTVSINTVLSNFIDNNGIEDLTPKSDDYIPTSKEMIQAVFAAIGDIEKNSQSNLGVHVQEIYDEVAKKMSITTKARNIPSKGNSSRFENLVRWALLKLKEYGLIENVKRGFYKLTPLGKQLYDKGIDITGFDKIVDANYIYMKIDKVNS